MSIPRAAPVTPIMTPVAGHDDLLGLVLAGAVKCGCDATAVMLVCRRWRDALLGRARAVTVFLDSYALLARAPALLSLTAGRGCTRLPWQLADNSGPIQLPSGLAHLTKLTRLEVPKISIYQSWGKLDVRDLAVLRGLRSLKALECIVSSHSDLSALGSLTELHLPGIPGDSGTAAREITNVLPHLRQLASLRLDFAPASLHVLAALTRLTHVKLQCEGAGCDLSHLSHLRGLRFLSLRGWRTTDSAHLSVLRSLSTLTRLELRWIRRKSGSIDSALQHLPRLRALASLRLSGALAAVSSLNVLSSLVALRSLDISAVRCSDSNLAWVSTLTGLRSLVVGENCNDACLANLRTATRLTRLGLNGAESVTEIGLAHVAALLSIRSLDLRARIIDGMPRFGRRASPHLAALGALEELQLSVYAPLDMSCLLDLSSLTRLELEGEVHHMYGQDVTCLSCLTSLQQCQIRGAVWSAESFATLGALPSLRVLKLIKNTTTSKGFGCELSTLSAVTALCLDCCPVTAVGVASVSTLQRLQRLDVYLPGRYFIRNYIICVDPTDRADFDPNRVSLSFLSALPALQQLTYVRLAGHDRIDVPDEALEPLTRLPALRVVEIDFKPRWDLVGSLFA